MSGGFLLSVDRGLYDRAEVVLTALGARAASDPEGRVVQLEDDGGELFTLFEFVVPGTEWEVRDGPFQAGGGTLMPEMQSVVACPFECRSPALVKAVCGALARTRDPEVWILDGDGVVWDASSVDPLQIRL